MKILDLLSEAKTASPSVAANWADLKSHMSKISTAITSFNQGRRLFRGLSYASEPVLHKPMMSPGDRVSSNTENYYTLFVDNHPSWAAYPPRSASMICSTSVSTASGYGTLYIVLVEGDPLIGVCEQPDFWMSFHRLHHLGKFMDLSDLNRALKMIMEKLVGIHDWAPQNYSQLQEGLHMIDEKNSLSFPNLPPMGPVFGDEKRLKHAAEASVNLLKFQPGTTMMEKLSYILDPQANGFSLHKLSSMPAHMSDREAWVQAPAWLINTALLPKGSRDDATFDLGKWILSQ